MVASVSALSSAGGAASYYEADDYYAEGGLAPSEWQGEGAEALGLSGDVDREQFKDLLEGKVAGEQLGTTRDGQLEHRPGWDVTLSAPKSVSIMAEVAGDRRLIGAHTAAVKTALGFVEKHMAATRIREDGNVTREATGNLAIASFQHGTSRAQDPQLHTHNVILNATQDKDGNWRSLEPRAIYQLQKQIGAVYRQELALKVRELGYGIETGRESMFEIKGVSKVVINAFSGRSAAIEDRLAERGKTREQASAAEKQIAALDTRDAKSGIDHGKLVNDWRARADASGFGLKERINMVEIAKGQSAISAAPEDIASKGQITAERAVTHAIQNLSERQSVFAESSLEEAAGSFGLGHVSHTQIQSAIEDAKKSGDLLPRSFEDKRGAEFSGFTTRENLEIEQRMLKSEQASRGMMPAISSPIVAAKAVASAAADAQKIGLPWNKDQRSSTAQLLTSRNRITALQGYAGTAKTTTVIATFAKEAEARGYNVTALAPTASAAMTLGNALHARADTVARHFLTPDGGGNGKSLWIVDEASLLSSRDTAKLFDMAEKQDARVLLVGDIKQLGSVEAGAAFAQLQSAGMETAKLGEILRQSNAATKEAVLASIEGDARKALAAINGGGGRIVETAEREDRFAAIAKTYARLDKAEQSRTLIVEPSREGRDTLTDEIRKGLTKTGELRGPTAQTQSLVNKGLTRAEARDPASYDKGDVIRFTKDYAHKDVSRGQSYRVESVDPSKAAIALKSEDGRDIDWRLRQWGAGKSQAFATQSLELKTGDRIMFTRNDRELDRINGQRGEVKAIDQEARTAAIKTTNGKTQTLDLDNHRDSHIRHAYVETAFAAQGRTADHVMIHADSKASNLIDQKSFYVAISRAKESVAIYTNDKAKLVSALNERTGNVQTAIADKSMDTAKASKSAGAGMG
jgi:conjugative relaxase-like TrwC/TraI family protein|tara:strand:- start:89 stop:2848 length:2760 start_codon:yes stop_codon:yes gene_type:complete